MKVLTKEELIADLEKAFPNCWFKDGSDFYGDESDSVWSGEGSYLPNDLPAFDYYAGGSSYTFGVHDEIAKFVEARGWYWECHDAGTFFAFKA